LPAKARSTDIGRRELFFPLRSLRATISGT
jgi:hypothetical protein